jgi:hypothetical protein
MRKSSPIFPTTTSPELVVPDLSDDDLSGIDPDANREVEPP